jgi:hypothetical protein
VSNKEYASLGMGLAFLIIVILNLTGVFSFGDEEEKNGAVTTSKTTTVAETQSTATSDTKDDINDDNISESSKVVTLGYTPDEFKNRFNVASQQIGSHLKIENLTIQDGPVQDTFNYAFNDQIAIVGSVHKKDGNVRDLMLICQSDGTPSSAADIFVAMGLLIMATTPDLNQDERTEVMKELGLLGDDIDLSNLDKKTIRNNIEYHVTFSPQTGFIFSAGHVNDQE